MTDRPDPLAAPAGYGVRPENAVKPDLTVCSTVIGDVHCTEPVAVIAWVGCTLGEHAGPVPYCETHGCQILATPVIACGECQDHGLIGQVKILKIESLTGATTELTQPYQQNPAAIQRALDWVLGERA